MLNPRTLPRGQSGHGDECKYNMSAFVHCCGASRYVCRSILHGSEEPVFAPANGVCPRPDGYQLIHFSDAFQFAA